MSNDLLCFSDCPTYLSKNVKKRKAPLDRSQSADSLLQTRQSHSQASDSVVIEDIIESTVIPNFEDVLR